ncbi:MAG: single-stranded DNA-binding protein [Nitrosomonas sp.]|nr:single-stranded DNA-binding protein [Nitrosomonas sp.]
MNEKNIELSDRLSVSKNIYECFKQMVVASLPQINPGNAYTLKKILGNEIWNELDNGDRRLMGRCVAHMTTRKILPLKIVKSKHEYPIRYQLK